MRIQNNIMALNTQRQYTINNDNVAKSAEKLSSGYRINRAGDDAAGLAISEKMRSQIRGLNMATKNSQDAISLVQTAEGALQETHSMLQRMNELANQSATGTNQELDRNALAKEFDQLKREINDVAEQTTFNNMKILDGSLSYQGPQRSAATAGIVATETTVPEKNTAVTSVVTTVGIKENAAAVDAKLEFDLAGMGSITPANADNTVSLDITVGGTTATLTSDTMGDTTAKDAAAIAGKFAGQTVTIDGKTYTAAANGTKITLTSAGSGATDLGAVTIGNFATGGTTPPAAPTAPTSTDVTVTNGKAAVTKTKGVSTITANADQIKVGDTLTIGDTTYEFVEAGSQAGSGNVAIEWAQGTDTNATLLTKLQAAEQPTGITIGGTAAAITATQDVEGVNNYSVKFKSADAIRSTVEFDTVKLKNNDTISVKLNGTDYTYKFREGDSVKDIAANLQDVDGNVLNATVKGNALIIEGKVDVQSGFKAVTPADDSFNAIRIQVGALEGEQLAVAIDSMNTAGLKLDDQNLYTQESAGKAITAVKNAVNMVSDQRAALGAMQNRLDHKIANLKVSAENLTAAESRIRDVDIASEMTEFTKNNILAQASTAMLAQANALPQNVLSLLR